MKNLLKTKSQKQINREAALKITIAIFIELIEKVSVLGAELIFQEKYLMMPKLLC